MVTFKLKTEEELIKIGYSTDDSIWLSKEEKKRRHPENGGCPDGFFSVIDHDDGIMGNVVTNDKSFENTQGFMYYPLSVNEDQDHDTGFRTIFEWASEYEITKEENPEYFL